MFSSLQERDSYFVRNHETSIGPGAYDPIEPKVTKEVNKYHCS